MLTIDERRLIKQILKGNDRLDITKKTLSEWEAGSDIVDGVNAMLKKYPNKKEPFKGSDEDSEISF
tara:strand:+ start:3844 stop:4041 length:198 start_codon:yes stop_codon:yes gene_type:complete